MSLLKNGRKLTEIESAFDKGRQTSSEFTFKLF